LKEQRRTHIRALNAVANFRASHFDDAINTFIELDLNPAKVVALYPETIAGRLSVSPHRWISLFGGLDREEDQTSVPPGDAINEDLHEKPAKSAPDLPASSTGTLRGKPKAPLGGLVLPKTKDDDSVSLSDKPKASGHCLPKFSCTLTMLKFSLSRSIAPIR
jgi:hypothetical protein